MAAATIHRVNASGGGVPKLPLAVAEVTALGIAGDEHDEPLVHGGPARALCLFPLELIEELRAAGHPIEPGGIGENVTTSGLDWSRVAPGVRLRLGGDVLIEVTAFTDPCKTIAHNFADGDFNRINQRVAPGRSRVYARVLRPGEIRPGDPITLEETAEGVIPSKREIVEGLRTSGARASETLRALDAKRLRTGVYEGGWNGIQLVAHIASIEWTYPRLIAMAEAASNSAASDSGETGAGDGERASGEPRGGIDGYNERQVAQRADRTLEQLIEEFERNRAATIEAVEAADEGLFARSIRSAGGIEGTLAEVFQNVTIDHVLGHLDDLTGSSEG